MADDFTWTREALAWAGGLFEGEGCIAVNRARVDRRQWYLVMQSTDLDVLERLVTSTGMGRITGPVMRTGGTKPVWTWRETKHQSVYALLVALYPWLGVRRQERVLEALGDMAAQPTYASRKCERGHPWRVRTVVRKRVEGDRFMRMCKTCLDEGLTIGRAA